MYVLEVIPLSSTAPPGSLSYRSSEKLAPGRIVSVKLRRRHVPGIVVDCVPLLEAKAMLKAASYALSGDVTPENGSLPPSMMEAIDRIALWHAATRGAILSSLFLELIRSDAELTAANLEAGSGFSTTPVELPLAKRAARYRTAIGDMLAQGRSALLVVPTLAEIEFWKKELGGFTPLVLSGALSGARRKSMLKRVETAQTLIIATPSFAWTPCASLGLIIVERVGAGSFRQPKRPYLDTRIALLELARARELPIMQGDFPLPLEYRAGVRKLPVADNAITVIDTRKDASPTPLAVEGEPWAAVPKLMERRLEEVVMSDGRAAVLAVRKGYAPAVVCRDCGETLKDERGKTYAFFVSQSGERTFRTSDGKSVMGTKMNCPRCASWNLMPLGVGAERVYEELAAGFPGANVFLFDADSVRTAAGAKKALVSLEAPGTIIVGTEAMVPWILATQTEPLELACIASADTLLALPFWRARERFLRLAYLFADAAKETLIATRQPDDAAVRELKDPCSGAFFEEELSLRKALGYPPSGTLISLQFEGRAGSLEKLTADIASRIGDSARLVWVADRHACGALIRRTGVLTLKKDVWPDQALSGRLASLPPSVRIMVDPETF